MRLTSERSFKVYHRYLWNLNQRREGDRINGDDSYKNRIYEPNFKLLDKYHKEMNLKLMKYMNLKVIV